MGWGCLTLIKEGGWVREDLVVGLDYRLDIKPQLSGGYVTGGRLTPDTLA